MRAKWTMGLLAAVLLAGPLAAAAPARGAETEGLRLPDYRTETLPNGLTVILLRQDTVPLVTFEVWVRAGAVADPAGKSGLAALTAEALRKGAGGLDAAAFAEAVDGLGARFGTSVNRDRTRITMNLQSKDFDRGLALTADAVLRPAFAPDEVAKLAAQMSEGVAQAKDNPRYVLGDYFSAFLYGDHPYGNPTGGTETGLAAITAADVKSFYADRYGADRTLVTVSGDIDPDAALAAVRKAFGDMPAAQAAPVEVPAPAAPSGNRVLLVNKSDTPQTWFEIGGLGPAFDDPDYAAAEVVRTVFGGRFTSWLNTKLRIENGLTYGVRYSFDRGAVAGPAYIMSFTATETTKEALDLALAQLDRLHTEGIGEADLSSAKAYLKGQTPYDFETAADLASAVTALTFYGVDRSRVDDLFAHIDAVTPEDCNRVIGKYFSRENLTFATIGVKDKVGDLLGTYGTLTVRENGDPGFR